MAVVGGSLDQMLGQQSLSNLLGQDKMTPALFRPPAAKPTRLEQAQETLTGVEQRLGETQKQIGEFEAQKQAFQAEQEAKRAAKGAELAGKERAEIEASPAVQESQRIALEAAQARFEPSQRNATENAALFSLIGAIGFAIGAGGKKNAMQAMAAMNGMVEGVRKGDMERYTREKSTFETNLNALYRSSQLLATEAKRAVDLASRNKEQARLDFESVLAQEGADFVKQYYQKFGLVGTQKLLEQQAKGAQRMVENAQKAEATEKERIRAEEARAAQQREAAQQRASLAFALKGMTQSMPGAGRAQIFKDEKGEFYAVTPQGMTKIPKPEGVGALMPAGGKGAVAGQNALTFASRVFGNIEGASKDLANLARSPSTATSPVFSGITSSDPNTVLSSLTALTARTITPQEDRVFQQLSDQLGAALSRLEAQGLATGSTKANIAAFNAMRPGAGDAAINMAVYLARVKQEIETGVSVHEEMPGATDGQKRKAKEALQRINLAIPFDIDLVLDVARKNKATLSDKMVRLLGQEPIAKNLKFQGMGVYDNDRSRGQPAPSAQEESAVPSAPAVKKEKARPGEVVHQDAQGNRAVKRDGQWVEVE